jgi:hypothetical protein
MKDKFTHFCTIPATHLNSSAVRKYSDTSFVHESGTVIDSRISGKQTVFDWMTFPFSSDFKKEQSNLQLVVIDLQSDTEPTHKFISTKLVEFLRS